MLTPVVYLGPSLDLSEAQALLDADYRPPVRRGDLDRVEAGRAVVILDGEFEQSLSVSLKEILRRLEAGSLVAGASSIGALRAAELATHGMIGIGRVFELYRTGRIDGNDEVAVSYCPFTMKAHTIQRSGRNPSGHFGFARRQSGGEASFAGQFAGYRQGPEGSPAEPRGLRGDRPVFAQRMSIPVTAAGVTSERPRRDCDFAALSWIG